MSKEDELNKLNENTVKEITDFLIANRENLNVYFFVGSGLLKYISYEYKLWNEIASKNINFEIKEFIDLIMLDFDYKKEIKKNNYEIKLQIDKEKNVELLKLWETFYIFFQRTNKINNKLKIITTNHCDTTKKYFKINEEFYLDNIDSFLFSSNYSLLKIHNFNKNEIVYDLESYFNFFNNKENYFQNLFKKFEKMQESSKNSNIFFIFGSSYSELHIPILLKTFNKNKLGRSLFVWFRKNNLNLNLDNLKTLNEQYKKDQNHWILFWNEESNTILKKLNHDIKYKINNEISFTEKLLYKYDNKKNINPNNLFSLIINDYKKNNKYLFNESISKKDWSYIWIVLSSNSTKQKELEWYIENIKEFNNTWVDFNWFLSCFDLVEKLNDNLSNKLINKLIEMNIDISTLQNYYILNLLNKVQINKKNYKWIINISWSIFEKIENQKDFQNLNILKYKENEENLKNNFKKCEEYILKFIKIKIKDYNNRKNIYIILYLFKLEEILKRKLLTIEEVYEIKKIDIKMIIKDIDISYDYLNLSLLLWIKAKQELEKLVENLDNKDEEDEFLALKLCYIIKNVENKNKEKSYENLKQKLKNKFNNIYTIIFESSSLLKKQNKEIEKEFFNYCNEKNADKILEFLESIRKENNYVSFDLYFIFSKIFNSFMLDISENDNSQIKKIFKKTNELILKIKEKMQNNFSDSFVNLTEQYNKIKLKKAILIIKFLKENNFNWFLNTFIKSFTLNNDLNITFDFYNITNENFSFIKLCWKIKDLINLKEIFGNNEDVELYNKIIKSNIKDFDTKTIFLKIVFDLYIRKIKIQDINFKKINSDFFDYLFDLKEKTNIHYNLYFLFLWIVIKNKKINEKLKIYLGEQHIKFYKQNANFLNSFIYLLYEIIKEEFESKEIKIIKDKICDFINNNQNLFSFISNDIDKNIEIAKKINEFIKNKKKIKTDEYMKFSNMLNSLVTSYNKNREQNIYYAIANKILWLNLVYNLNINLPPGNRHNKKIKKINLKKSIEEIKEKIGNFINNNAK